MIGNHSVKYFKNSPVGTEHIQRSVDGYQMPWIKGYNKYMMHKICYLEENLREEDFCLMENN